MAFPTYPFTTLEEAVTGFEAAADQIHKVVNGSETTEVVAENGNIPSLRKIQKDFMGTGSVSTTDATQTSFPTIVIADDTTYCFSALIVARRTDVDDESAGYEIKGVVDRNAGVATASLVGTITKAVLAEDTVAWDVTAEADITNGGLVFKVTGEAAKSINWVLRVTYASVTG